MLIVKHTGETTASTEEIWALWEDVNNWNLWDHDIEFSTLDGPFITGTTGTLKPKGGPIVHTRLSRVEPMKGFVDESKLFCAHMIVSHAVRDGGTRRILTVQVEIKGPLAWLFTLIMGRAFKKSFPESMGAMIKKLESDREKGKSV